MSKDSPDCGKTSSNKMNLSNSPKSELQDAQITASGKGIKQQ